jgi:hypothetical protein
MTSESTPKSNTAATTANTATPNSKSAGGAQHAAQKQNIASTASPAMRAVELCEGAEGSIHRAAKTVVSPCTKVYPCPEVKALKNAVSNG